MANGRDTGPASLYAALVAAPIVRTLNAPTRPTRREQLLELLLIATEMEAGNGELRFPRNLILQADDARRAGRRLEVSFDEVTHEHVLRLTPAETTGQQQIEGT
jgi:hypothetical protein